MHPTRTLYSPHLRAHVFLSPSRARALPSRPRSAYLLWALFGVFGAHRFYVGRPVSGLVWLLTGGLLGIGWLVDACLIPEFVEEVRGAR